MSTAILGHRGMVGQALMRRIPDAITTQEDLTDIYGARRAAARFAEQRVDTIICAAARVGGIQANSARPVEFGRTNLLIAINVIEMAHSLGAKLVYLGSSCIYPRDCPQPIKEEYLGLGVLEETNEAYAWAKMTGVHLCRWYERQRGLKWLAPMPCNLYGPGDCYDPARSHVLPALIAKFHQAKVEGWRLVTCWGTGTPKREFMHVDDCADAILWLLESGAAGVVNVGSGFERTIKSTAEMVAEIVGYCGAIEWDESQPDGTPRKVLDCSILRMSGWDNARPLRDGIEDTYRDYMARNYQLVIPGLKDISGPKVNTHDVAEYERARQDLRLYRAVEYDV